MSRTIKRMLIDDIKGYMSSALSMGLIVSGVSLIILAALPIELPNVYLFTQDFVVGVWLAVPIYIFVVIIAAGIWISLLKLIACLFKYYILGQTNPLDHY